MTRWPWPMSIPRWRRPSPLGRRSWPGLLPGSAAGLRHRSGSGAPPSCSTTGPRACPGPTGVAGTHGAFLGGMLAGMGLPAAPPSPPDQPGELAEAPMGGRSLLEQLRAARLAVGVADGLARALRAADAERAAEHLVTFEQASRTYHATAGEDAGDEPDEEAGS